MNYHTLLDRLEADYEARVGPFDPDDFPERRIVRSVEDRHVPFVLTYTIMLDYNRSVDSLVDSMLELYDDGPIWFDPSHIRHTKGVAIDNGEDLADEIAQVFGDIGLRYPNRDARAWVENSVLLAGDGGVEGILDTVDDDAVRLVEHLRDRNYLYLKGAKLAPFYARVVHEHVRPLDRLHELPIPVDTHVRQLSQDLFGDVDDDEIRARWTEICDTYDAMSLTVDRYLWLIGYNGADEYWDDLLAEC